MKDTKSTVALRYCAKRYTITKGGKLLRPDGSRINPVCNARGYPHIGVRLRREGIDQKILIHRIVAYQKYGEAMIKPGTVVRHLNENKLDFSPDNIARGTAQENLQDNSEKTNQVILQAGREAAKARRLFTDDQVRSIRERNRKGEGYQRLAKALGCSKATICGVVRRQFYRDV